MVEQLGLAMMPPCPYFMPAMAWVAGGVRRWATGWAELRCRRNARKTHALTPLAAATQPPPPLPPPPSHTNTHTCGLTSGMTSGTPSVMRKAEELSTTVQPAAEARGAYFLLIEPPAEKSAMSTPAKLQ